MSHVFETPALFNSERFYVKYGQISINNNFISCQPLNNPVPFSTNTDIFLGAHLSLKKKRKLKKLSYKGKMFNHVTFDSKVHKGNVHLHDHIVFKNQTAITFVILYTP